MRLGAQALDPVFYHLLFHLYPGDYGAAVFRRDADHLTVIMPNSDRVDFVAFSVPAEFDQGDPRDGEAWEAPTWPLFSLAGYVRENDLHTIPISLTLGNDTLMWEYAGIRLKSRAYKVGELLPSKWVWATQRIAAYPMALIALPAADWREFIDLTREAYLRVCPVSWGVGLTIEEGRITAVVGENSEVAMDGSPLGPRSRAESKFHIDRLESFRKIPPAGRVIAGVTQYGPLWACWLPDTLGWERPPGPVILRAAAPLKVADSEEGL